MPGSPAIPLRSQKSSARALFREYLRSPGIECCWVRHTSLTPPLAECLQVAKRSTGCLKKDHQQLDVAETLSVKGVRDLGWRGPITQSNFHLLDLGSKKAN